MTDPPEPDDVVFGSPNRVVRVTGRNVGTRHGEPLICEEDAEPETPPEFRRYLGGSEPPAVGTKGTHMALTFEVTAVNPDDLFDADAREFGEPTPGPWVRITSQDPPCDYKVAVMAEDGAEALGRRIFALVGEALSPVGTDESPPATRTEGERRALR